MTGNICEGFESLSHPEKVDFLGGLVHAVRYSADAFTLGEKILNLPEVREMLKDIRFTGMPTIDYKPFNDLLDKSGKVLCSNCGRALKEGQNACKDIFGDMMHTNCF